MACGGGGSSSSTITAVTVSCTPTSLQSGQTSSCTATVTGTGSFNTAVTWGATAGTHRRQRRIHGAGGNHQHHRYDQCGFRSRTPRKSEPRPSQSRRSPPSRVTCSPTAIQPRQNSQCLATANGGSTTTVNWSSSIGTHFDGRTVHRAPGHGQHPGHHHRGNANRQCHRHRHGHGECEQHRATRGRRRTHRERRLRRLSEWRVRNGDGLHTGHNHLPDHRSRAGRYRIGRLPRLVLRAGQCDSAGTERFRRQSAGGVLRASRWLRLGTSVVGASAGGGRDRRVDPRASHRAVELLRRSGQLHDPNHRRSPEHRQHAQGQGNSGHRRVCAGLRQPPALPALLPNTYYSCPTSGCGAIAAAISQQVTNPVTLFPNDNNGSLIQLPPVFSGGSPTAQGSLIFGIGTQPNNGLLTATVYGVTAVGPQSRQLRFDLQQQRLSRSHQQRRQRELFPELRHYGISRLHRQRWLLLPELRPDRRR